MQNYEHTDINPGEDAFHVGPVQNRPNVRSRPKATPCHPWCSQISKWNGRNYHQDYDFGRGWQISPCEGIIECIRCQQKARAASNTSPQTGPVLFCVYCVVELPTTWQQAKDCGRLIERVLHLKDFIKAELPQPIWEELLEHLQ